MTVVALAGCRPEPLGSYLKALGLLRLLAEQADPAARGWWDGDAFWLDSGLDADGLADFLLTTYRPTPVLSPWNKDAGFKEGSSTATERLVAMERSDDERFKAFRQAIGVVRRLRADPGWEVAGKAEQVTRLRNELPDEAIAWLDAAIVLRPEKPAFPALLGAGGNFGRLELSPTFIAAVQQVLGSTPKARTQSEAWLRSALFAEGAPRLASGPIGQFDPGAAGGVRSDAVGIGSSITNPWDFVLVIEGSLVWAAGVARRASGGSSLASIPFTVAPTAAGHASVVPGERSKARAELWAPLWTRPLGLAELRRLFAEGRLSWGARQARSGTDAVRAIRTLGVDAGIDAFVRHLVADRMGQSPLAVPVGRFAVRHEPTVAILATIDPWVDRLLQAAATAPNSVVRAANRVERAVFAASSGDAVALQDVLVALAAAEIVAGRTERARTEGPLPPVGWLPAKDWLPALDDGSPELRLAASIAVASDAGVAEPAAALARTLVRPVSAGRRGDDRWGALAWTRGEPAVSGLGARSIDSVLGDMLVARSEAPRSIRPEDRLPDTAQPWFATALAARPGDAEALAAGAIDLERFAELVPACLLLSPTLDAETAPRWRASDAPPAISPAWRILAPFYARHPLHDGTSLRPRIGWARQLVGGAVNAVLDDALLRWTQAGFEPTYRRGATRHLAADVDGSRLAAALLTAPPRRDVVAAQHAVARRRSE